MDHDGNGMIDYAEFTEHLKGVDPLSHVGRVFRWDKRVGQENGARVCDKRMGQESGTRGSRESGKV